MRGARPRRLPYAVPNCQRAWDIGLFQNTTVNHDRHSKWRASYRHQTLGLAFLLMLLFSLSLSPFLASSLFLSLSPLSPSLADFVVTRLSPYCDFQNDISRLAANSDLGPAVELCRRPVEASCSTMQKDQRSG